MTRMPMIMDANDKHCTGPVFLFQSGMYKWNE